MLEDARPLAGFHLFGEMINHACGHAFVRFARAVNVEVTQPNDDPIGVLAGGARGDVVNDRF